MGAAHPAGLCLRASSWAITSQPQAVQCPAGEPSGEGLFNRHPEAPHCQICQSPATSSWLDSECLLLSKISACSGLYFFRAGEVDLRIDWTLLCWLRQQTFI